MRTTAFPTRRAVVLATSAALFAAAPTLAVAQTAVRPSNANANAPTSAASRSASTPPVSTATSIAASTAVWTPPTFDSFERDRRTVEAALARGFFDFAASELARLETTLAERSPVDASNASGFAADASDASDSSNASARRFRFGSTALKVAVETGRLATVDGRTKLAERIGEIRSQVEPSPNFFAEEPVESLDESAREYAVALAGAYFALGLLDVETARAAASAPNFELAPDSSQLNLPNSPDLTAAFELSRTLAKRLPTADARPFVYRAAKTLLVRAANRPTPPNSLNSPDSLNSPTSAESTALFDQIGKLADALERSSRKTRDEFYFFARLLQIETARVRGDLETAAATLTETTKELADATGAEGANDSDAASLPGANEIGVALSAEALRLAALEGKSDVAAELAGSEPSGALGTSGGGASRFAVVFFDPIADFEFARAVYYWTLATTGGASGSDADSDAGSDAGSDSASVPDALAAARSATARLTSNVWRTRAAALVGEASRDASDFSTLEAAAQENYRNQNWAAALADYDRAIDAATSAGDADAAFRASGAAAGIADKIVRDKLFESDELPSSDAAFWRREAARRALAAARVKPDAPEAPALFRLGIEYAESLDNAAAEAARGSDGGSESETDSESAFDSTALRSEFLTLFPAAPDRDSFAVESARRALADCRTDDAAAFFDAVETESPALPAALDVAKALWSPKRESNANANADSPESSDVASAVAAFDAPARRLLAKALGDARPDAETPLPELLAQGASTLTTRPATPNVEKTLETLFELAAATRATQDADLNAALERLLDAWDATADVSQTAQPSQTAVVRRSFRLSLGLDAQKTDAVLRLIADDRAAAPGTAVATLARLTAFAETTPPETRRRIGEFVLAALDGSSDAPQTSKARNVRNVSNANDVETRLVRAEANRLAGKRQDALAQFAQILKSAPKNLAATRGIARLLSESGDRAALERAVRYWSDVADLLPVGGPDWWDAKERVVETYCRLGESERAAKIAKTLWLTRSDPTDPGRRARWERLIAESGGATPVASAAKNGVSSKGRKELKSETESKKTNAGR